MTSENVKQTKQEYKGEDVWHHLDESDRYDPFERGQYPVGVRTIQALDSVRHCLFPCEIWYPADKKYAGLDVARETRHVLTVPKQNSSRNQMAVRDAEPRHGTYPLIIYSHPSGGNRQAATFLCAHLSSHGYVVSAMDHSELVAPELARKDDETDEHKAARIAGWIANRVPDVRFLLDHLLRSWSPNSEMNLDSNQIGIVGHSFGGWTALAAIEVESRFGAVVALAPGGCSRPKPGILPVKLNLAWGRDVPTLYLVAEDDISMPIAGMYELFERTRATKKMVILRRADHLHFMDDVEHMHEMVRSMPFAGELAWIPKEMRPIAELCSGEQSHLFVRGLTLCHLDAVLRKHVRARQFLTRDLEADMAVRGVEAIVHES